MRKFLALIALIILPVWVSAEETVESTAEPTTTTKSSTETEQVKEDKIKIENIEFTYYHGDGCSHCAKVNAYYAQNDILKKYNLTKKEVWKVKTNQMEFSQVLNALGVEQGWVPFLLIYDKNKTKEEGRFSYLSGDTPIISYFKDLEKLREDSGIDTFLNEENANNEEEDTAVATETDSDSKTENENNTKAIALLILWGLIVLSFGGLVIYKGKENEK